MDFKTVKDIPHPYRLLTGDEAFPYTETGCAFVLLGDGEVLDAYVTESKVPYLDTPVRRLSPKEF